MTKPTYDRAFWEARWTLALRDHADVVAKRPPSAHLVEEVTGLAPGRALDAGCGHGADTLWLAAHGWDVTAVDFSATALGRGRETAGAMGADIAERITWVESDVDRYAISPGGFDLVISFYVHIAGSVEARVRAMASGVAVGGTLLMVGHRPIDPATGEPTPAANQVQVSVEAVVAALDAREWEILVAEERTRTITGSGVDAVVRARRAV